MRRLNGIRRAAEGIEQAGHLADLLHAQLASHGAIDRGRQGGNPVHLIAIAEELRRKLGSHAGDIGAAIEQVDRELRQVRDAAEGLRLVPADTLFTALERTARDAARALSKQVVFEATGGDIRLDAECWDWFRARWSRSCAMRSRTASSPKANGSPPASRPPGASRSTSPAAAERSRSRAATTAAASTSRRCGAVQRGVASASTKGLQRRRRRPRPAPWRHQHGRNGDEHVRARRRSRRRARSGGAARRRGHRAHRARSRHALRAGRAAISLRDGSAGGRGRSRRQRDAIPLDAVRRTLRLAASDMASASAGASILFEDKAIAFLPLATALDAKRASVRRNWTAIIVAGADGIAASASSACSAQRRSSSARCPTAWAQARSSPARRSTPRATRNWSSTPTASSRPPVASWRRRRRCGAEASGPGRRRLADHADARAEHPRIGRLRGRPRDVRRRGAREGRRKPLRAVPRDVEMPGMDGFTFVERIRADPALRDIPAILVTSRNAPEDRQRGRDAGAQGYIVKSEFDQADCCR